MPLHKINWKNPGHGWGIWHVAETEAELTAQLPQTDWCPEAISYPRKRLEWLAGRRLVQHLVQASGVAYQGIVKDEFGKPFLKNLSSQISISNSFPYVAAQIHPTESLGIDLEQPRQKLFPVMRRVLSEKEWQDGANNLHKLCVYWCAKEALYKIYGKRSLIFTDEILIQPFALGQSGLLTGMIKTLEIEKTATLQYAIEPEYVLLTTYLP